MDWKKVENELIKLGVKKVFHIKAQKCIKDVFLTDLKEICDFLNIEPINNIQGTNGIDKLKRMRFYKTSQYTINIRRKK